MVEVDKAPEQLLDEAKALIAEGKRTQGENQKRDNELNERDIEWSRKEISVEESKINLENESDQLEKAKKAFVLEKLRLTLDTKKVHSIHPFLGGEEPLPKARMIKIFSSKPLE